MKTFFLIETPVYFFNNCPSSPLCCPSPSPFCPLLPPPKKRLMEFSQDFKATMGHNLIGFSNLVHNL